jgi:hypothetical protein
LVKGNPVLKPVLKNAAAPTSTVDGSYSLHLAGRGSRADNGLAYIDAADTPATNAPTQLAADTEVTRTGNNDKALSAPVTSATGDTRRVLTGTRAEVSGTASTVTSRSTSPQVASAVPALVSTNGDTAVGGADGDIAVGGPVEAGSGDSPLVLPHRGTVLSTQGCTQGKLTSCSPPLCHCGSREMAATLAPPASPLSNTSTP